MESKKTNSKLKKTSRTKTASRKLIFEKAHNFQQIPSDELIDVLTPKNQSPSNFKINEIKARNNPLTYDVIQEILGHNKIESLDDLIKLHNSQMVGDYVISDIHSLLKKMIENPTFNDKYPEIQVHVRNLLNHPHLERLTHRQIYNICNLFDVLEYNKFQKMQFSSTELMELTDMKKINIFNKFLGLFDFKKLREDCLKDTNSAMLFVIKHFILFVIRNPSLIDKIKAKVDASAPPEKQPSINIRKYNEIKEYQPNREYWKEIGIGNKKFIGSISSPLIGHMSNMENRTIKNYYEKSNIYYVKSLLYEFVRSANTITQTGIKIAPDYFKFNPLNDIEKINDLNTQFLNHFRNNETNFHQLSRLFFILSSEDIRAEFLGITKEYMQANFREIYSMFYEKMRQLYLPDKNSLNSFYKMANVLINIMLNGLKKESHKKQTSTKSSAKYTVKQNKSTIVIPHFDNATLRKNRSISINPFNLKKYKS